MKSLKTMVALVLAISATAVHAEESWHLNLHTVSHHFNERKNGKEWNEENLGLGIRREFSSDISVQAGFYRNSIDKWSTYAVGEYTPVSIGNVHAGIFAGVRTNYSQPVMAAAGAVVRWQGERYSVSVRMTPKIGDKCAGYIALELGWKL